jgi:LPXTG-motif cell wall-anchored protein
MTGIDVLVLTVAILLLLAALTIVWARKRRSGGVLVVNGQPVAHQTGRRP